MIVNASEPNPQELAELSAAYNMAAPPPPPNNQPVVSSSPTPQELQELNAANSPISTYLGNGENYLKSAATYAELPVDVAAKTGQAIFNIPHALTSIVSPTAAQYVPYSNQNMTQEIGNAGNAIGIPAPTSPLFNTAANIGSALVPGTGEVDELGNALKFGPGVIGDATKYIGSKVLPNMAIGAGMNTKNPGLGLTIGGIGSAAGAAPDFIQSIADRWGGGNALNSLTQEGISGLKKSANSLEGLYKKNYGGLNSVGEKMAVTPPFSNPWDEMSHNIIQENPEIGERLAGDPTLGTINLNLNPDAVRETFPQEWLKDFEDPSIGGFPASSNIRTALNNYTQSPTLKNADFLKQEFNSTLSKNPTSNQIDLLNNGKNFVRNNIIQPALNNIDPVIAKNYMAADTQFAVHNQIYQENNAMNNLIRGTTIEQTPKNIQGILKPIIQNASTPQELASNSTPEYAQLYNAHMNQIRNLYDQISKGTDKSAAQKSSLLGKAMGMIQRNHLINYGGDALRTGFQYQNALNSPGQ